MTRTALEIARDVRSGATTASAVAEEALAAISAGNGALNAFTTVTAERARADAARVDRVIAQGQDPGPLAGVPFAVKDLYAIAGITTKAGSKIHASRPPATEDATAVRRLSEAGGVLVGALNMEEYGYGFYTDNPHHGRTRNPLDLERTPGGSSGVSAAAVAAGLVPFALGSDANGSIRVPAAFCGIYGLKPTYGRISRKGGLLFISSLDHVGPLARNVGDLTAAYDAMQGPDPRDPVCAKRAPEPVTHQLGKGLDGLRVAVVGGYFATLLSAEGHAAVEAAANTLAAVDVIDIPHSDASRATAYMITSVEAARERYAELCERPEDFDPRTRTRFLAGMLLPAEWYAKAQQFRRWYAERWAEVFKTYDVVIAPVASMPAPRFTDETVMLDGAEHPIRPIFGRFVATLSPTGLPIAVTPNFKVGPLPMGVQLVGAPYREEDVLRCAAVLEASHA